jgi:hypothetical protein
MQQRISDEFSAQLAKNFAVEGAGWLGGWARWVSPVLRAPIPAALCHGARGPERRRA